MLTGATGRMGRHMTSAGSAARAGAFVTAVTTGRRRGRRRIVATRGRLRAGLTATFGLGFGLGAAFATAGRGRRTRGRLRTGLATVSRLVGAAIGTHCTSVSALLALETGPRRTTTCCAGCVVVPPAGVLPCAASVAGAAESMRATVASDVRRTTGWR